MSVTRYPELDFLRGFAFLGMAAYHLLFDLFYFYGFPIAVREGYLLVMGRTVACTFLILVGIGSTISLSRLPHREWWRRSLFRAIRIGIAAAVVTLVTGAMVPDAIIRFGILHLIAASALFAPIFFEMKQWNLAIGTLLILMSPIILNELPNTMALLPIGATPPIETLDYYPILPWLGVILIGLGLGHFLYVPTPHQSLAQIQRLPYPRPILWCGKRALFLYMVHQPVLMLLLWLVLGRLS